MNITVTKHHDLWNEGTVFEYVFRAVIRRDGKKFINLAYPSRELWDDFGNLSTQKAIEEMFILEFKEDERTEADL